MNTVPVEDIMVPLEDYATVSVDATLLDAIKELRKAQEKFSKNKYTHRAILVLDAAKQVVGKLSQVDIIRAFEPKYGKLINKDTHFSRYGFSDAFLKDLVDHYDLWSKPIEVMVRQAAGQKVSDIMYSPEKEEFIDAKAPLTDGIHQLILGRHNSLLVMDGGRIVGILRLTDMFKYVADLMLA